MTSEIPHGYEWPRFEDGALVQHRDARPIDMTPPPRRRGEERK